MNPKSILYGFVLTCFISTSTLAQTPTTTQNQQQVTTPQVRMGNVPVNVPQVIPTPTIPDYVNFAKFNVPRTCSPAEMYQGKTSCNMCDADTPNIIMSVYDPNAGRARAVGGVVHTIYSNSPYRKDQYHNAWSFDSRGNIPIGASSGNRKRNENTQPSVILHGYNLKGIDRTLAPLNNRTKCETFRPKYSPAEAAARGDKSGFNGANVLGIGGTVITVASAQAMMNPNGNKGLGQALGNGNAAGSINQVGGVRGIGIGYSNIATEAFACLEYYTNSNTTPVGGDHLMLNSENRHKCQLPMRQFYQTVVLESCPYLCDDGDGIYRPLTIIARYLFLMQNPFFLYGNTAVESWKIASQRPNYQY